MDPGLDPYEDVNGEAATGRRIARALAQARWVLWWEAVWPHIVAVLWLVGLGVALSWLGPWPLVPDGVRRVVVIGLGLAIGAAIVRAIVVAVRVGRTVDRPAALARVAQASGITAHALADFGDRLPDGASAATKLLWAAHRARLAGRLPRLGAGLPHPDLGRRDRHALRPALGLALFVGWFAAGDDRIGRLLEIWPAPTVTAGVEDRLDVWIDPPAHTGLAPITVAIDAASGAVAAVPAGSRLEVRVAAGAPDRPPLPLTLEVREADEPMRTVAADPATAGDGGTARRGLRLDHDVEIGITARGAARIVRRIAVTADRPPSIRLATPVGATPRGALRLAYEAVDDWGVTAAEARLTRPAAAAASRARPLVEPPRLPLVLPVGRAPGSGGAGGRAETIRDLTAHPLAGARLDLTLVARDAIGQEGASETVAVDLPERPFHQPLARALVELRRRLALDATARATVAEALEALTLAPERFTPASGVHLGLRFLQARATAATSDGDLVELLDLMWTAALTIEGGDLSTEERALRAAQEALAAALEHGGAPEEIERAMRELREALDRFVAALARQPRPEGPARPGRTLDQRDLARMLDRIEGLARTGSRDAARQLLSEMREMLEALQNGGPAQAGDDGSGGRLQQLGELMRRQQSLMEETHRSAGEGGSGADSDGFDRQRSGQRALREDLGRLGRGGPGESGDEGADGDPLARAGEAMDEAAEALGRGDGTGAVEAQGRALDALRQGARALADRLMRPGEGAGRSNAGSDPLGRPRRGGGALGAGGVRVPDEIEVERARRILEDIRRRLGTPSLPRLDKDYLDRLLDLD